MGRRVLIYKASLKQIGQNKLDDRSDFSGTPALAKDAMYLRSGKFVYCIGTE